MNPEFFSHPPFCAGLSKEVACAVFQAFLRNRLAKMAKVELRMTTCAVYDIIFLTVDSPRIGGLKPTLRDS